jgi:hypothetical protein
MDCMLRCCKLSFQSCFISWIKAHCVFPTSLVLDNESYVMTPMPADCPSIAGMALQQERKKGFSINTGTWEGGLAPKLLLEFGPVRSVSDKHSWVIDIDTTDITTSPTPDTVLDTTIFSIDPTKENSITTYFKMQYQLVQSCVLRYNYVCLPYTNWKTGRVRIYSDKLGHMIGMLNDAAVMQLTMLSPVDRPPQYAAILANNRLAHTAKDNFTAPNFWTYYGEDFQRCVKARNRDLVESASQE